MSTCRCTSLYAVVVVAVFLLSAGSCYSQVALSVCKNGEHVVLGNPFSLSFDEDVVTGLMPASNESCTFMDYGSSPPVNLLSGNQWTMRGSQYVFNSTGTYGYNCYNGDIGNVTVVPSQYIIPLCKSCEAARAEYSIRKGGSLRWVLVPDHTICRVVINDTSGSAVFNSIQPDNSEYIFQEVGTFMLHCEEDAGFSATIVVQDDQATMVTTNQFLPLLYAHTALMIAAFGVLLPIAVFLYYLKRTVAYLTLLAVSWVLALCGLVLIEVYIQLTDKHHVQFVVHAVLSYFVLFGFIVVMPLLLLHEKLKAIHRRLGHVVMATGITCLIAGLPILPAPFAAAVSLCVVYAVWMAIMAGVYVFYSPKKTTTKVDISATNASLELKEKVRPNGTLSHNPSSSSLQSRGPQPLTKNVISDAKMVQLRKKSMDFLESQRQMRLINEELGVKHNLAMELEIEEDESHKVRAEQKVSKSPSPEDDSPTFDEFNDDSRARLNPSSPEMEDPFSPPVQNSRRRSFSSDDEDNDNERTTPGIARASTFNYTSRHHRHEDRYPDSDASDKGGSVRITRHSKRARVKLENMFNKSGLLDSEVAGAAPAPVFSITPSTPQRSPRESVESSELQDQFEVQTQVPPSIPVLAQPSASSAVAGRRRKAAMVPPIIPDLDQPVSVGEGQCPFHSNLAVKGQRSPSPRPIRRGASPRAISPSGSSGGEVDPNAPPKRKKKVSVAQIEATVVPPTPVNLVPPQAHASLSRSSSFETLRTHQDAFADNAFRSIMQISQNAIVCANSIGDIVFWSAGACKMFGYTPGEAVGSSLEMIIPTSFKERHRNGISKRTENTMKYIRKHSYAPEEQKHARLYEVRGVTKGGHELPVEVNVTSFVLDGEMFYTGVISEMAKPKDSKRSSVSSSMSDLNEVALHQRALAVGAQMKIAHKLRSAEHISRRELEKVLKGSLGNSFEVEPAEMEVMITGIMKAGDPEDTGAMTFVSLIQLLSKHQLYISESGLIARYGKTKGLETQARNLTFSDKLQNFLSKHATFSIWFLIYLALNLVLFAAGVGSYSTDMKYRDTWRMWAYGTGPVLSMNTVLVLLPTLFGLIHSMKSTRWMNILFPLKSPVIFHVIICGGIVFWTVIHLMTHLTSFAKDNLTKTSNHTFRTNIRHHVSPTVTGLLILIIFVTMGVSSIKPLRTLLRYIPFRLIHWVGGGLFYFLLLIHGVNHWSPSYWKWLLPALVVFSVERLYRHVIVRRVKVGVKCAGRYDSVSRTAIVELEKPMSLDYEPGQYIMLNLPKIGQFEWKACHISSGPKEEKLTIHIPFSSDLWFSKAFEYLKSNPYNMAQPNNNTRGGGKAAKNAKDADVENGGAPSNLFPAYFTGPYGTMDSIKQLFKYKISALVCGGQGPHATKAIIKKFLDYRKTVACHCGCQPSLSKLYVVWVIPSGNDFEWFTDYLSELCEDEHLHHYLHIRVFLTNCDSAPDELASALLQLGLKTAGDKVTVRRPSQPQLNNLYQMTSYGLPDFTSLLEYISSHHSALWKDKRSSISGVFTVGDLSYSMNKDLQAAIAKSSKPEQMIFNHHRIIT